MSLEQSRRGALRLGTRRSALALAQSAMVAEALRRAHPGIAVELVPLVTRGDRARASLAAIGGKGLFTAELEAGLLEGSLDLAVHSLKDLPVRLPAGLVIAACPERADPRDVLVSEAAATLEDLPAATVVLTSSLRRQAQVLRLRSDLVVEPVRGNVDTRLRQWRVRGGPAALLLAAAGLARLGLTSETLPAHPLDPERFLPAPGQGILAVEVRAGTRADGLCRALDHAPSARAARAERAVVAAFGGDCTLPLAAWARTDGAGRLRLTALVVTPDGTAAAGGEASGDDPDEVARACVEAMRRAGADAVLARLRG